MIKRPQLWLMWGVLATCVGCDQASKHIATITLRGVPTQSFLGDVFRLTYVTNPGAFLSMGADLSPTLRFWILTVVAFALSLLPLAYALTRPTLSRAQVVACALLAGGGLSNWVDRIRSHGLVVDFLNLGIGSLRTGIFNLADVALVAGVGLLWLANPRPEHSAQDRLT